MKESTKAESGTAKPRSKDQLIPPRTDRRRFRHELTPVWLRAAATFAGESTGPADLARVAWFGCGAPATPAVVAAVDPGVEVCVWDPLASLLVTVDALRAGAGLPNLTVHDRPSPPDFANLGACDLVVIDGVLDAVTDGLRDEVLGAISSLVRPGSFVAVRYGTTVGWGEVTPLVRLLRRTLATAGSPKSHKAAFDMLALLRDRGAAYVSARPYVAAWLDELLTAPIADVIESYCMGEFHPMSHAQVSEAMSAVGASFVTSAYLDDPLVAAPAPLSRQVRAASPSVLRESLTDLAVRRTFRVDVFRLGSSPLPNRTRRSALQRMPLVEVGLDGLHTLGASWAVPTMTREVGTSWDALRRRGGASMREVWPEATPRRREALVRQALGAGLLHPAVRQVPDGAAEAASRLTAALQRQGRDERDRYVVAADLGTALPRSYVESLGDDRRPALGIGAR